MATNSLRFTGLASGLDTESIVNSMLQPYKARKDTAWQQQKLMELKKDAWKEMNNNIYTFYTKTLNNARLESTFNKKSISTSTSGIIEVSQNTSNLPEGTHKVDVKELAENAMVEITSIKSNSNYKGKETELCGATGLGIASNTTIKVNGKDITIDGTNIKTIGHLENELKTQLGDNYNVSFDEEVGAFFISSKKTGKNEQINFSANTTTEQKDALTKLGIKKDAKSSTYTYKGEDSQVFYNGIEVKSSSNTVTVNGMEMKLTGIGQTTVIATHDADSVVDFAKNFVEEYNKLIEDINKKVDADYNKSYKPLTSEQKKEMSEDEIKLWEERINSSILRNDSVLTGLVDTMRNITTGSQVQNSSNKKISLASLGITTGNWREKGKLYIDEDKLRKAVSEDADAVAKLFTDKTDGIGTKLYAEVNKKLKGNTNKSSNFLFDDKFLDKQIKNQKEAVFKLEDKMSRMESMYYKKFAAMEKMMSQLNNQSSWLSSQLGGM